MEIPKEIVGRKRLRDLRICCEYIAGVSPEELSKLPWVSLTVRRVYRILFANQAFINPRISWPKSRRIWMLQNMIDKADDSKKDKADLIEQIRKEQEGDKPLIDQSVHTTYVWESDKDKVQPSRLSEGSPR